VLKINDGLVAELRMTHKPLVLPNGNVIPANALIAVPDPLFDQTTPVFDDCNTFDGARYVKLASNTTSADGQYAFSAISSDDLTFGYGVHACPGRHFASAEVKLIISKLIMEYDFKFEGNVVGRPENNFVDFMTFPPTVNLLFKARGHELLH
jgi:cytochrome P450